jgi:tetratricopeptide (TPR) repeat protein
MLRMQNGQVAIGAAALERIAKAKPPGEHAAEAAFHLARVHIEQNDAAGWTEMEAVAVDFPAHGVGRIALHKVLVHDEETGGDAATLAHIEALSKGPLGKTDLVQTLDYQAAVCTEHMGKLAEAREAYLAVAARYPYPFGRLFDDALWRASEIDEKLGKPERAIEDLERMLAVRETAHLMGTYERPRFQPALMRIAVLYRDKLGDRARARDAYRRAWNELGASSPMRDDAAWEEAQLLGADGDQDGACGRLQALVSAVPSSRYVPCATERCPKIERPKDSKAPKECRGYIERRGANEQK